MSNIDKQALREAAEMATQGDWKYSIFDCAITDDTSSLAIVRMDSSHLNDEQSALNGVFIAAANPTAVLALLDELEAKDKRIAELEATQGKPVMFIDGDISPADAEKLAAVIREFNEETKTPAARMARIIRENPHPTNMCDMPAAAAGKGEAS